MADQYFSGIAEDERAELSSEEWDRRKHERAAARSQSARSVHQLDDEFETCVVFDVSGDWAHFARPNTSSPVMSYGIPPGTTITGLVAAILGYQRDSYYRIFYPENSRVALSVNNPIRTEMIPMNYLDTKGARVSGSTHYRTSQLTSNRQRVSIEYVVDPSYRLYIAVKSRALMDELEDRLKTNQPYYPPALGKAECLASLEFVGRYDYFEQDGEHVQIDSIIPGDEIDLVINSDHRYVSERVPAFFDVRVDEGIVPHGWETVTFDAEGAPTTLRRAQYASVGADNVIFW